MPLSLTKEIEQARECARQRLIEMHPGEKIRWECTSSRCVKNGIWAETHPGDADCQLVKQPCIFCRYSIHC